MADTLPIASSGRAGTASAFLIENRDVVRPGDDVWHEQGRACAAFERHVHPRSRPPVIVFEPRHHPGNSRDPLGASQIDDLVPSHPVPRWEVRVSHYRDDGTVASVVETLLESELAARTFPIGPWASIRALAGAAVSRIRHAERDRG